MDVVVFFVNIFEVFYGKNNLKFIIKNSKRYCVILFNFLKC